MYKKVVVPLDGSNLAEVALTHLEKIAKDCPEVLLVSVTEKVEGRLPKKIAYEEFVPERPKGVTPATLGGFQAGVIYASVRGGGIEIPATMGKMAKTAGDYLCRVAERLEEKGFNVTASVIAGNPAEEILRFVEQQKADLIIMGSRGKSGFSRWDIGNIAEKVVKAAKVPVLLVKPSSDFKETKRKRRGVSS